MRCTVSWNLKESRYAVSWSRRCTVALGAESAVKAGVRGAGVESLERPGERERRDRAPGWCGEGGGGLEVDGRINVETRVKYT